MYKFFFINFINANNVSSMNSCKVYYKKLNYTFVLIFQLFVEKKN